MQLGKIEIKRNIITNVIYLVSNALSLFVVYKLIIDRLGQNTLGVWSILYSFLVVIINSGSAANANLVRKYLSHYEDLNRVFIGKALVNSLLLYLVYFLLYAVFILLILVLFLPEIIYQNMGAIGILLGGMFFGILNFALSALLDATKLNFLKNLLSALSVLSLLIFAYFFINLEMGIIGISYAFSFQYVLLFILLSVNILIRFRPLIRWHNVSFPEIIHLMKDGWKLQAISLLTISYDPITKYFLLQTSSLGFIAKFEIINRLINQIRLLIISSNQTLLPNLLGNDIRGDENQFFVKVFIQNVKVACISFSLLILAIPVFEWFFFREVTLVFSAISVLLGIGVLVNIFSVVFYFYYLANARLNKPLGSHIIIGAINFFLPLFYSFLIKWFAVNDMVSGLIVVGIWSIALIAGSVFLIREYKLLIIESLRSSGNGVRYTLYFFFAALLILLLTLWPLSPVITLALLISTGCFVLFRERNLLLSHL